MLHIFWLSCIYCIDKLVTCESTIEMKHLIFLFKNVTTWRQMLSVFRLIFKHFKISSNPFLVANTDQNEKKLPKPGIVCHGLQGNAFQVNQLYNVTWSNVGPKFQPPSRNSWPLNSTMRRSSIKKSVSKGGALYLIFLSQS